MPLEGYWQRVNTPLRRLSGRERNIAIAAVVVTIAACVALIVATAAQRGRAGPGCIRALIPRHGRDVDACGARAKHICQARAGDTDPGAISVRRHAAAPVCFSVLNLSGASHGILAPVPFHVEIRRGHRWARSST